MRIHRLAALIALLVAPAVLFTASAQAPFKVIGYVPSWAGEVSQIDFSRLTHVNYAFALPNSNGTLRAIENTGKLQSLVTAAHARGVKVSLSIGGWNGGNDSAFEALAANTTARTTFVNACLGVQSQYNLDGIDIDWEYPDPGASGTNYTRLMQQLCTALHGRGKLCTAAVVAQGGTGGGIQSAVFSQVDYLMIMAYDGGTGAANSPYSYAVSSLDYWLGRGLPASKAVLGVPFYGRGSTWSAYRGYNAIVALDAQAPFKDQSGGYHYNGIATMKRKTQLARDRASGVMIWEMSQDTRDSTSLLRAIREALGPSPTPTPTTTPTPTPTPTPGCLTATASSGFLNNPLTPLGGTVTFEFDATPSVSITDAVVGLSQNAQTAYTGFATLARFNSSGRIDARNGGAYAAASAIPYAAGVTYHFRLVVNVSTHTYSIFVTPQGGAEQTVGTGFAFRTEQGSVTSLNNWGLRVNTGAAGSTRVCGVRVSL
jgi:GH18 family chitinase